MSKDGLSPIILRSIAGIFDIIVIKVIYFIIIGIRMTTVKVKLIFSEIIALKYVHPSRV